MTKVRIGLIGLFGAALATAPFSVRAQAAPKITLKPAAAKLPSEFSSIAALRELGDGRVLVTDPTENKVVVVDFAAGTVTQVGRSGQGPGEYQTPGRPRPIGGDSTLMVELRTGRWHLFAGAKLVATVPADNPAYLASSRQVLGADGRRNVVRTSSFVDNRSASIPVNGPDSTWIIRTNRSTARSDTLGRARTPKSVISSTTNAKGEITSMEVVRPPFAVGEELAFFEDGWLAIARLDPYRIDWIAPDGRVTKGKPLPWSVVKITERDVETFFATRGSGAPPAGGAAAAEEARRRKVESAMKSVPDALPPTVPGGLIPLDDARLLVRHPDTADQPHARYDLVDRRGALVGTIAMPKGETIVAISRKWAYVAMTDDDGLQYLRRHPWP